MPLGAGFDPYILRETYMPRKRPDLVEHLFGAVRAEKARRLQDDPSDKISVVRGTMQAHQRRVLENVLEGCRWISVISPRQTGKSTGVMLLVVHECLRVASAEWVVIGLTRPSVKRIYWTPLKKLNQDLELGIKFNDQELTARLPNGSCIYFVGGDTISEIEKLRGGRFHGAVVDECKSYAILTFLMLLEEILQPALNTHMGPLIIIGTPGDILKGEFYLATCRPRFCYNPDASEIERSFSNTLYGSGELGASKWSLHEWTLQDNTAVPHLWTEALALKKRNRWPDDHPVWMREFLGKWVSSDTNTVYRYVPHLHDYAPTGEGRFGLAKDHQWLTVVGVDLGVRDGTAIVVWAYSPTTRGLWEVYSEVRRMAKGQKFPLSDLVEWYHEVEHTYGPFQAGVADHQGATMVIDTLASDHGIYLDTAEKREKLDHIELLNLDFDRGLIHILPMSDLAKELLTNRWDERKLALGRREEDRQTPNDTCDAALYAFRWAMHRYFKPKAPSGPEVGTPAWWAVQQAMELDLARKAAARRHDQNAAFAQLDQDWWEDN